MGLVSGLRPKHQKLILRCYPAGKSTEKKPNNAELSYLLYYATTRRTKLEKVGVFLEKKTAVDTSRVKTGNIQVTLDIIAELTEKCSENLGVFAGNIVNILTMVVKTGDLALCQHSLKVLGIFCKKLNSTLAADKDFISGFSNLVNKYAELGAKPQKPNESEWLVVSLVACRYVAVCLRYSYSFDRAVIQKAVALILSSVTGHFSENALLAKMKSHVSMENDTIRAAKTVNTDLNYNDLNVEEEAINSLKALFNTDYPSQLSQSTRAVGSFITSSVPSMDQGWSDALIEMIASWTPVQLRYLILESLISEAIENKDFKSQKTLIDNISALLSSSVVIIGLSVRDVVSKLLDQQDKLVTVANSESLVGSYSACIQSLAEHIIYKDQISDMVDESLLVFSESYLKLSEEVHGSEASSKRFELSSKWFIRDISGIIDVAHKQSDTVERQPCSLGIWNKLFSIIGFESIDNTVRISVQKNWLDLLIKFFTTEFTHVKETTTPDYHNYITSNEGSNAIVHIFASLDQLFAQGSPELYVTLAKVVLVVIDKFSINALYNGMPYFFRWQAELSKDASVSKVARDSLSMLFLLRGSQQLEIEGLEHEVRAKIAARKANGVWYSDYDFAVGTLVGSSAVLTFSKPELISLLSANEAASKWLVPSIDPESHRGDFNMLLRPSKVPTLLSMSAQSSFLHLSNGHDSIRGTSSAHDGNIDDTLARDNHTDSDNLTETFDKTADTQSLISVAFSWAAHSTAVSRHSKAPGVKDLRKAVSGDILLRGRHEDSTADNVSVNVTRSGLANLVAGLSLEDDHDTDGKLIAV
ncbi:unnamed protein product [Kuraishia capsulata CBS 1993]|uniref:Protein EFR3 n=1 Tax=Kuraishia capsulata CBS 1993 TaxID=1382522 RepID=W6MT98_9ASCO|nr:uncharacterized protein KUCA_T00004404001 [Kuraishia capsulata CBS 1993]CDK28422.1 unnamed protein product [Kuraishia capsulata CBS 1993]